MQTIFEFISILSLIISLTLAYRYHKFVAPLIKDKKYYEYLLTALIQDGTILYYIQNLHSKKIQDIELKIGIENADPKIYENIKDKILAELSKRVDNVKGEIK